MSRLRRMLSIITASLAVLALGFVVAVAAGSLPGENEDEPLLDLAFRANLDLFPILKWILLIFAVLGAVRFVLGLRENQPRVEGKRRNILGALIGLVVFVVIARWLRPVAEALLEEGSAVADSATEALAEGRAGTASGWLFSIILAAVLTAALTRIGLSIRAAPPPFQAEATGDVAADGAPVAVTPLPRSLGGDPRSRILYAYERFEDRLAAAGQPRDQAETTAHHARRAARELSLDSDEVRDLIEHHSWARYGNNEPTESAADTAELSSSRLQERMEE